MSCIHSETTEGTQFDTLLEMVADLGRNIFKLFQVQYRTFNSVVYVAETITELSLYCAYWICMVGFVSVVLGDRYVSAYECRHTL